MAGLMAKPIVAIGKRRLQPLHSSNEIPFRGLEGQVKMITHYRIRVQHPLRPDARFEQAGLKGVTRTFVFKGTNPPMAAVDHMINCPGKFQSQLSCHDQFTLQHLLPSSERLAS